MSAADHPTPTSTSRRGFLGGISRGAVATASVGSLLGATGLRNAHAAGDDEIRVAVVGCGGRGTGATIDALSQWRFEPGAGQQTVEIKLVFRNDE